MKKINFQATTSGVYLRSDLNTFIPNMRDQFNEDPHAISVVPKAAFVALFAVGVRSVINDVTQIWAFSDPIVNLKWPFYLYFNTY